MLDHLSNDRVVQFWMTDNDATEVLLITPGFGHFIDGPYPTKAKYLLELTDGWDAMHQRGGESFTSARKRLITDLITNLKGTL